jgi:zinc transporter ZupT
MGGRFFIPIAAMLVGLGIWIAYFVAHAVSDAVKHSPPQVDMGLAVVAGGLIVVSCFA